MEQINRFKVTEDLQQNVKWQRQEPQIRAPQFFWGPVQRIQNILNLGDRCAFRL